MAISKEELKALEQCKDKQEAIKLVKKHHILNDEELDCVNGGDFFQSLWGKIKEKTKDITDNNIDQNGFR